MTTRDRAAAKPGRYGVTHDRAEELLAAAGWWVPASSTDRSPDGAGPAASGSPPQATRPDHTAGDGRRPGPVEESEPVLLALSRTADPDQALLALDRLREAIGSGWTELNRALHDHPGLRGRLLAVLGGSTALADYLVNAPEQWRRLMDPPPGSAEMYTHRLLEAVRTPHGDLPAGKHAIKALRAGYRGMLLEIAAADLGALVEPDLERPTYAEVTARLTALAEAALRVGLDIAWREVTGSGQASGDDTARLSVIAMGKTGGRELNYVSDVDVIFVAEGDLEVATRVASTMMRVVGAACFEVDAALRPEGKAGALVRTLEGHRTYYQKWARTWEFQALLKARPVAGDEKLGQQYAEVVTPLVWSAAERENFVADVRSMRRKVESHVPAEIAERELKLGRGGLRDVEFAVQLLQLVHGRADVTLRSPSTMEALAALGRGGYLGRADAAELESAYEFLRTVEHRLQLRRLRRTHLFPPESDIAELRWLARALGVQPSRGRDASEVLVAEYRRKAAVVRKLHEKVFYRPLLEAVARVPTEALRLTTTQAASRLAALGYTAPDGALSHIKALTSGVSRRAAIQKTLLPVLLDRFADTPDPDGGLLAYRRVSEALAETPWYLRVLRDEGAVVDNLATVLGTSKLVPDLLVRAPEVLRLLGNPAELTAKRPEEVAATLQQAVRRQTFLYNAVSTARSLRRHEMLRVACADVLGLLAVPEVCAALSSVWDAVLDATLAVSLARRPSGVARIAIIGMGRLGGSELGYGADADVLFVCEPYDGVSDREAVEFATEVCSSLSRLLGAPSQDPAMKVDTDLRPEGRQGPLVRTLSSYQAYYDRWGEVWEAQALLRARPVAGDEDLARRFIGMIEPVRYPAGGLTADRAREVRRIKARVDSERLPRGTNPRTNTKLGPGGLADVEWTVQLLQLMHGHEIPELRTVSTLQALQVLQDKGVVAEQDAVTLRDAWLLATRVRNAAALVRGKQVDQVPTTGKELASVARIVGYGPDTDPGEFLDSYLRTMRRSRAVVERIFYRS
ncbi:bifunctional [glutamine synthetase] adenylyltransferase/[glutamine synthetase]-adenylyl-L-tyrosine phosphorylase [Thermocrispum sp.]|uniref:bifunctional [glutamine synthetase] adenylyltransferase/[glutamine synthetase]-adenylyl-L-tyrosine phosphorylase n=1 Tax=Thermocrispum sp. TaxID=2060768 RepID=UPI00257C92BF|nr:bifunctional [glutamine synthetase] adenylyltransferase/[glutamine synthetase]-adenylyl-L-tyrosine phosphorylase [Thermocrispum sp.]